MKGGDIPSGMSGRDQRTLIIGVCIVAGLVLCARGIPSWYRWQRNAHESARAAVDEAAVGEAAVRNSPITLRMLEAAEGHYFGTAPAFVHGEQNAAASASLTSVIGDAADGNNVRIGALQARADSVLVNGLRRIAVRGDASGDVTGITHFISSIEAGAPLLAIRELTLTQADPNGPTDRPETLRCEFVIEAIARAPESEDQPEPVSGNPNRLLNYAPAIPTKDLQIFDGALLGHLADTVTKNDPFRFVRQPAQVAFGTPVGPITNMPQLPKVQLMLSGIIGGPPWRAVLSGVPGHDGSTVVSPGDTVGGLKVRSVRRDTVVVQGVDTTWTLTTRR